jgi:hypothetical protein
MAAQGSDAGTDAVLAVFNAGPAQAFALPCSCVWRLILDTTRPDALAEAVPAGMIVPAQSVLVFASKGDFA